MAENRDYAALMQDALRELRQMRAKLQELEQAKSEPLAVIGMGCRLPGADNPIQFWELLKQGKDAITSVPSDRWNIDEYYDPDPKTPGKICTRYGGFVGQLQEFDPQFFGISPREAISIDPQQRLLLEVSWEALENAGIIPQKLAGSQTGVFIGISSNDYSQQLLTREVDDIDAYLATGNSHSVAAGRLSFLLGLTGPSLAVDTACSSSLVAVHLACQSLRNRECQTALVGGVNRLLSPEFSINFSKAQMLAPDGRCKTFDHCADGFVRSEGCGVVVLKRLEQALSDGDNILAVIRGSAVNQDGRSSGLTVPNGPSQQAVIRQALENGKIDPAQISYIEAHGTGTSLGDPIEIGALGAIFKQTHTPEQPLIVGSLKTNIGHLEAAAGIAGLIKVVLSLQHQEIPPHLHFQTPSPHINWDELPITVPTQPTPWKSGETPRFAGLSSFGFSGTNVHIVLGEVSPKVVETPKVDRPLHLLTLSAKTEKALQAQIEQYKNYLITHQNLSFADICFSVNKKRSHFDYRLSLIASSASEAAEKLNNSLPPAFSSLVKGGSLPIAFLFTGQGSQYMGMGQQLYQTQTTFKATVDHCCDILQSYLGWDLREILFVTEYLLLERGGRGGSPASSLDSTINTQPALFVIEYALAKLWLSWGIKPNIMIGHSIGEYVAATLAGVFSLEDGLKLITARAQLMQALPETGSMVAVFATLETVKKAINSYSEKVSIAAVNHDKNIVISGENEAIKEIISKLELDGIQTQTLNVSHAFHCPMMEPMLEEFEVIAKQINYSSPKLKLVSTVTGTVITDEIATYKYWCEQIRQPVKFAQGMECLGKEGIEIFLEIGPKPTLLNLGQIILEAHRNSWLASLHPKQENWQTMLSSLGQLYIKGCSINWDEFDKDYPRNHLNNLPTYPFQREKYWFKTSTVKTQKINKIKEHPLLGNQLNLAKSNTILFEGEISQDSPNFLQDHRVFDTVILPAAGFLEMALTAAIKSLKAELILLENIIIQKPIVLADEMCKKTQLFLTLKEDNQQYQFEIFSEEESNWILHAKGQISLGKNNPSQINLTEIKKQCNRPIDTTTYYQELAKRGINLDTNFQAIKKLWQNNSEQALAEISLSETLIFQTNSYTIHPVLLDACFQAIAITLLEQDSNITYLPIGLDKFSLYHSNFETTKTSLLSHVKLRPRKSSHQQTLIADIEIVDHRGTFIAAIEGLQLNPVSPESLLGTPENSYADWLYEIEWRQKPTLTASCGHLPTPEKISDRLISQFTQLLNQSEITQYRELLPKLDDLSLLYIIKAFEEMGWQFKENQRLSKQSLTIANKYQKLANYLLKILTEAEILNKIDEQWHVIKTPPNKSIQTQQKRLLTQYPFAQTELSLLDRCASQLAQVLQGNCDPMQLLFPQGDLTTATQLYQNSPGAKMINTLVQQALNIALEQLPQGKKVRILEIGAGTGGTTAYLLSHLDATQTDYCFSDISPIFTEKAQEKFSDYPFITYQTLNIEQNPQKQGFSLESYDIIIAANVLHATANLQETVTHIHQLLAPKGMLLLLESTSLLLWLDLIFGLTEGWWKFNDELRGDHPLISAQTWEKLLIKTGFEQTAILKPDETQAQTLSQQSVILGQKKASERKHWLILGNNQGIGEPIIEYLQEKAEYTTLGQEIKNLEQFQHIIYVGSLDTPDPSKLSLQDLEKASKIGCSQLLTLVQTLAHLSHPPSLFIVTRGAVSTKTEEPLPGLAQASLWGLGKVINLEYPQLNCRCIDLDPEISSEKQIQALIREIELEDQEPQIALRNNKRQVARLVRYPKIELDTLEIPENQPFKLDISQKGTLSNLQLVPTPRRSPKDDEVEIKVEATGLNFIDVLDGLGLLPFERGWFGVECVGEVVTVGKGVKNLKKGDRILALAPGSFRQYLTVTANLVTHCPKNLTVEEGATIPANFLTAYYALHHIAKLKKGDRILIHSAAGGTGMAALQIAQQAGAEVFATASPNKWAFLQSLGVKHIMNSRTLDFAEEILTITQGKGVDVVFNSLSGDFMAKSFSVLSDKGRFLEIGKREIWTTEQVRQIKPHASYFPIDLLTIAQQQPQRINSMLTELKQQFEQGHLKPLPYKVFPIQQMIPAFRYMQQAKHIGKVVVSYGEQVIPPCPPLVRGVGSGESQVSSTENFSTASSLKFREDGTYLITGGLGGLGLLVAQWMVEKGARNLVLMGRNQPNTTQKQKIQALKALGANIVIAQGDISDKEQLAVILQNIETSSPAPLKGIIHAAGVLDDGVLLQMNWERFKTVMSPKVQGAWNLHCLTKDKPLDFFVLFSSAASLLGSPGQGNHVAANTFLDTLAHYRRSQGLPALSINWGVWSDIGAAAQRQVEAQMKGRGIGAIAPQQGLDILEQLLTQESAQVGVVPINWSEFLTSGVMSSYFEDFSQAQETQKTEPSGLGQQLADILPQNRLSFLVNYLQREVAPILGLNTYPNPQQGFFDMGMDSLMAVELKNRLETGLRVTLPSTVIFEYPTIKALAEYLAEEMFPSESEGTGNGEQGTGFNPEISEEIATSQTLEEDSAIAQELEELETFLRNRKHD
ncbi:probable polyketide synthase [Crocosphaera subtropica ATCC 51142]|uniref:Probable polyketide synthase n=1 Tax=Crocosphaera subtropica (strain ATCC 51142 / BH68) TaxID=43989 RepID=B1WWV8_CROS5|nr:type I polyketide synthase [Crocosphaera subtropica]ACB52427.1 probable polyketide synthase [Crocosphaera subtropica ATCC 51142]